MAQEGHSDILRRKIGQGGHGTARPAQARPVVDGDRVFDRAIARAAQEELALELRVTGQGESRASADDLAGLAGDHALMVLLDGPDGVGALLILSAPLVQALVMQRIAGRVALAGGSAAPRSPTRIDADLTRDLIDRVLAELGGADPAVAGFHYAGFVSDPRLLRFSLSGAAFRVLRIQLVCDGMPDGGVMSLILPLAADVAPPPAARGDSAGMTLRPAVLAAPIALDAVLARFGVPLSRVVGLSVGDVLPLAPQALDSVRIETADRVLVATGRLGQMQGARAVRVTATTELDTRKSAPAGAQAGAPAAIATA